MAISSGLRGIIDAIHAEMQTESDPKAVATLGQCLQALTRLQQEKYTQQPGDARSALLSQLQGAQGAGGQQAAGALTTQGR